jgi:hypothetical protein
MSIPSGIRQIVPPVAITAYGADQYPLHGRAVGMKFLIQGLPERGEHGEHPRLNVGNTNTSNDPDCGDDLTASLSAFGDFHSSCTQAGPPF